jgi:hypothetical protein
MITSCRQTCGLTLAPKKINLWCLYFKTNSSISNAGHKVNNVYKQSSQPPQFFEWRDTSFLQFDCWCNSHVDLGYSWETNHVYYSLTLFTRYKKVKSIPIKLSNGTIRNVQFDFYFKSWNKIRIVFLFLQIILCRR